MSEMPIAMRNLEAELMSHKVSGLLKIYLLKSFFNNLFVEVNCQGNTNNTGNNGAGKTSLLSLIPIFYGAEPNTVVSREAGKSSFVQYYLPANASLLAFEYLHLGEKRCVLLYSHESQLYYRFVACSGKNYSLKRIWRRMLTLTIPVSGLKPLSLKNIRLVFSSIPLSTIVPLFKMADSAYLKIASKISP